MVLLPAKQTPKPSSETPNSRHLQRVTLLLFRRGAKSSLATLWMTYSLPRTTLHGRIDMLSDIIAHETKLYLLRRWGQLIIA